MLVPRGSSLYGGPLPLTIAGVSEVLTGHDLAIVIGAQVFRYYPFVPGDYLPAGTDLLQVTADPHLAATAPVGDSLLGDAGVVLEQLLDLVEMPRDRQASPGLQRPSSGDLRRHRRHCCPAMSTLPSVRSSPTTLRS